MKISMRILAAAFMALCLSLLATSAMAQTSTTGSIAGLVTDVNGAAVPGVTITASSPNLIRTQSATSNQDGRYEILNLPPGNYQVVVEATKGFARFNRSNVEVNLSKTSSVDVQLQPAGANAIVNVTDTAGAAVDVTSNTSGSNVSSEQFQNFPTQRTVQSLYTIAPTTTRSGLRDASGRERDPSVGGSSGPENNYILDGVNTTDPAFGGAGANLPFEFVQEVEVKTGAFGAEYGKSTGGIFNVITKSGGNEFHGDLFGYFTSKGFVRAVKNLPFTGSAANGFSEEDIGGDIGGPIKKDKLWFFAAFNPQFRKNYYLTQTFLTQVTNDVKTPFYSGKLTYAINQNNTLTFSTFGDFTKITGFLATGALTNVSGFGNDPTAFLGTQLTGGHNYAARLNSTLRPTWILEAAFNMHFQRANTIPQATSAPLINDTFAILRNGAIAPVTQTGVNFGSSTGNLDYVYAPGGSLQRNFARGPGFGLYGPQQRNRYEGTIRLQNIYRNHTFKYGFEYARNVYNIQTLSSGPSVTFPNPLGLPMATPDNNQVNGYRVASNSFSVCTTRGTVLVCPSATAFSRAQALVALPAFQAATGLTSAIGGTGVTITTAEALNNPFLIRLSTRVRDFELHANTHTASESFYFQDDYKVTKYLQLNLGMRWDYQQAYSNGGMQYLALNSFADNAQPRLGFTWDFTHKGRGKLFANYALYVEQVPLDMNVRAGGGNTQTDKNFNVSTYSAGPGATIVPGINAVLGAVNLGADATPIDPDIKPQTVYEWTAGGEYEIKTGLVLGFRGIYRAQKNVIEDGSFDDGNTYFLFNPGDYRAGSTEVKACSNPAVGCFGHARRYYRAIEFTATKRFTKNYQFIASYVYSSLTGNYEGLFRNDNGQSDPNITSLFDLVSLLTNTYGRLPNDRPHQFKFNGSYRTPFKLVVSGNFYAQSGVPFNQLIPHPVYGNNEGFGLPRGTAIVPNTGATVPGGSAGLESAVGTNRGPFVTNLDLGFYYPIVFKENKQLRLQLDWFNALNSQRALTLDQTFLINSGITGVPPVSNPFYGSGLIFQFPSSLRLGVKFQF